MITLLAAMVATQMAPPTPVKTWIAKQDFLQHLMRGNSGATGIQVLVAPDGNAVSCKVVWSTGNAAIDRESCSVTKHGGVFTVARDENGRAAWGEYRDVINFDPQDGKDPKFPYGLRPDLELAVKQLPGARRDQVVKVAISVDEGGSLAACDGGAEDASLVSVACERLREGWQDSPMADASGRGVPYVAARWVRFRAQ